MNDRSIRTLCSIHEVYRQSIESPIAQALELRVEPHFRAKRISVRHSFRRTLLDGANNYLLRYYVTFYNANDGRWRPFCRNAYS